MKEAYKKILSDLEANADIEGGFITTRDGILIYTNIEDVHAETFAAMSATLLSSAEVALDEVNGGVPKRIVVEGKNKKIVAVGAGAHAMLAVVTTSDVEKICEAIEESAKKINEILSEKND